MKVVEQQGEYDADIAGVVYSAARRVGRSARRVTPATRSESAATAALEGHGHTVTSSIARITASTLPADFEERHSLRGLGPWLLVQETCITMGGLRVVYAEDYHRGDQTAFNVLRQR